MKLLRAMVFWIITSIFTGLMVLKTILAAAKAVITGDNVSNCSHDVAGQWGRGVLKLSPFWDFKVTGREHLPKQGDAPIVIVANHQSSVDIWALYLLDIQFRWLSKAEVFDIPLLGTAMKLAGYVSVKRGDAESQAAAFKASRHWLRQGVSMVYFPEGSRSLDGKLKPFKTGAFRLSELERVDILPMAIRGTSSMLKKTSYIPSAAHVDIQLFPPTRRQDKESLEDFVERVRMTIDTALHSPSQQMSPQAPISKQLVNESP